MPWVEKAIIARVWFSTSDVHAGYALEHLRDTLNLVHDSNFSLSAPATHAAQILLWKRVEAVAEQEQDDSAEAWCLLCLHPILEKAGAQNKVKINRCVHRRIDGSRH